MEHVDPRRAERILETEKDIPITREPDAVRKKKEGKGG
jgi:hypothetical protein